MSRSFTPATSPTRPGPGVLVSGGLDSCILLAHMFGAGSPVAPIFIRAGLVWESAEARAIKRFLRAIDSDSRLRLVQLHMPTDDLYESNWSTGRGAAPDEHTPDRAVFLPGRNALLIIKAAIWCQLHGRDTLAIGTLGTSPFEDASQEFVAALQEVLNRMELSPIRLVQPLGRKSKLEVVRSGASLPLELTFSCIAPVAGLHCGRCNKCAERRQAFAQAGIPDRTEYAMA